jgi:hypothetical protein
MGGNNVMKKIIAVILLVSVILFGTIRLVNAEEVEDTSTSSPTTDIEVELETEEPNLEEIIIEENQPSDLDIWFEENLGWFIGIPTGTALTTLIEILVLASKAKKKKEEIEETKEQNTNGKEILTTAKDLLTDTKNLTRNLEISILSALDNIEATDIKVTERVNELTNKLVNGFETLNNTIVLLENRLSKLEDVQEMIALHSKELIANGTAEEITKKIRG